MSHLNKDTLEITLQRNIIVNTNNLSLIYQLW